MRETRETVIAAAVVGGLATQVNAQGVNEVRLVTPVPVEASSILPHSLESLPGSSSVMTSEEIRKRNPFSIVETLREMPGLHVVAEDVAGTHLNIGLRGLNPRRSSRTLLLEDGAPTVFLAPYGDPSSHYSTPLDRVDRIELLKGSGQILYGPQTMGGMINFVTRPVPVDGTEGSVRITGGYPDYLDGHFNIGTGNADAGIMLDLLKKGGDGIRREHDFDVQDIALKGTYRISSTQRITGKYSNFQEDSHFSETGLTAAEYHDNPFRASGDKDDLRSERFEMTRHTAQLIHEWDLNEQAYLSTQAYYSKTDRTSRRVREFEYEDDDNAFELGTERATRPRDYEFFGIEPKLQLQHNAFGLVNEAVFGVRYHEESIDRKKYEFEDSFSDPPEGDERLKVKVRAVAAYAQNAFLHGNWTVTPGIRFERITYDKKLYEGDALDELDDSLKDSKSMVLPGIGVTWNGLPSTTIFAGIHRGFAPPRPDRDVSDAGLVPTDPEISVTSEIGVRTSYFRAGHAEATLFNMDISDLVVQGGGGNNLFRNAGRAQHTGLELAGRLNTGELLFGQRNNFYFSTAYTYLFTAKFKDSGVVAGEGEDGYGTYEAGNRLPYAPEHMLTLNLSYERPDGWLARLGMTYLSRQFANTQNYRGTSPDGYTGDVDLGSGTPAEQEDTGLFGEIPALTLFNASVSYSPVGQKFTVFATVENLTDKRYFSSRTNGLQPGRGRMAFAGFRYGF